MGTCCAALHEEMNESLNDTLRRRTGPARADSRPNCQRQADWSGEVNEQRTQYRNRDRSTVVYVRRRLGQPDCPVRVLCPRTARSLGSPADGRASCGGITRVRTSMTCAVCACRQAAKSTRRSSRDDPYHLAPSGGSERVARPTAELCPAHRDDRRALRCASLRRPRPSGILGPPKALGAHDALLWDRAGEVIARRVMGLALGEPICVLVRNNTDSRRHGLHRKEHDACWPEHDHPA